MNLFLYLPPVMWVILGILLAAYAVKIWLQIYREFKNQWKRNDGNDGDSANPYSYDPDDPQDWWKNIK